MPGAGKTTMGLLLAKYFNKEFIDTDALLEKQHSYSIQFLLDRFGVRKLRKMEQELLCSLSCDNHIISTGGSAVYSDLAMLHLKSSGKIVYLNISSATLRQRVDNISSRGLVKSPKDSLMDLYHQRLPLYEKWAEITFDNNRPLSALQFSKLIAQLESA